MVLLSFNDLNQGARKPVAQRRAKAQCCNKRRARFSFIRTVTVGSGIAPDLLTLQSTKKAPQALAGSCTPVKPQIPPVGSFAPP